jgi:hypothetical protein
MSIISCRKPNQDSLDITTAPRSVNLLQSAADVAVDACHRPCYFY